MHYRKVFASLAVLTVISASVVIAGPATAQSLENASVYSGGRQTLTTDELSTTRVWVVGTPTDTFAEQVQRSVEQNPDSAAQWVRTLIGLETRLEAGNDVFLPGSASSLAEKLTQVTLAQQFAKSAVVNQRSASAQPEAAQGTTYELRGYAINNNFTWQVNTEIDGGYCDPDGCETTDTTRQTWKITPGRTGDKFSFTSIRTGDGNLSQIYANLSVLCNGSGAVCGSGSAGKDTGPQDGSGSGSPIVTHPSTAGGSVVDRVQLHAYFQPNGGTYYDSVKTGTAGCGTGDQYGCAF